MDLILSILKAILQFFTGFGKSVPPVNQLPSPATDVPTKLPTFPPVQPTTIGQQMYFVNMPDRTNNMLSGSEFAKTILSLGPVQEREDAILSQIQSGNVPEFMRTFSEVVVKENNNELKYFVAPDYLCVGNDADFIRTPMTPITAMKIGSLFNCILPTQKMALQIFAAADLKCNPDPMGAPYDGTTMCSTQRFIDHNAKIQKQIANKTYKLITGIKKDVVYVKELLLSAFKKNECIFGWFYPNGQYIQNLQYAAHDLQWRDYSHGLRLVSRKCTINGKDADLFDILNSKEYASLISDAPFDATKIYI
jgi:hypothetical protein